MAYICPACGFPGLREPPRSKSGGGSYEICPSCGFQFGVSDDDAGFSYASWRAQWKAQGLRWSSKGIAPPPSWNPKTQVAKLVKGRTKSAPKKKSSTTRVRRKPTA